MDAPTSPLDPSRPGTDRPRRSGRAALALLGATLASLLGVSLLVVSTSRAAFSATTVNDSNSIDSGALTLTDNDSSSALFSYSGVYPGWTQDRCIKVDYSSTLLSGTAPGAVKLYLSTIGWTPPAAGTSVAGNLTLQIDMSTAGSSTFGDCTGFAGGTVTSVLASTTLGSLATGTYSSGTNWTTWTPSGTASETRYFRFRMTLPSATSNLTTTSTGTFAFTWETQK